MRQAKPTRPTIGILYPGEMGSAFAKILVENGFPVVTTLEGRSARTRRLCHEAGLTVLGSLREVLTGSDCVMSFVTPAAALELAGDVAALLKDAPRRPLYVDANSISPATAARIEEALGDAEVDFVDACIFGLASQIRQRGRLYLSGARAHELLREFEGFMRVKVAGDTPGQASAFKMIISGIPKGLVGLFAETMLFARDMQLLDEALEACNEIYPSIMEVIGRMLPTYPQHAARRAEELREVEQTMLLNGMTPRVLRAVREVTGDLAQISWSKGTDARQWTIADVIEEMYSERLLHPSDNQAARPPSVGG